MSFYQTGPSSSRSPGGDKMKKNFFSRCLAPVLCVLILAACRASPADPEPPSQVPSLDLPPIHTTTPSAYPSSLTPPSTRTGGGTATLTQAEYQTPAPSQLGPLIPPALATIDPENAGRLAEMARLGKGPATTIQFVANGKELGVTTPHGMYFYDPSSGDEMRHFDLQTLLYSVSFSPDGKWMAATSIEPFNNSVRV
jgi:hypothetical protein